MNWFSKWAKSPPLPPEQIIDEFLLLIRERAPDAEIEMIEGNGLKVKSQALEISEQTMFLGKMLHEASEIPGNKFEARRGIYEKWWGIIAGGHKEIDEAYSGGFESVRERIYPKIVQPGLLEQARQVGVQAGADAGEVPHLFLGSTPFPVVFVIDFPDRVSYILAPQMKDLGVPLEDLKSAAWRNAARLFPRDEARAMIEGGQVIAMFCAEGHNSARAVLLPEYLEEGEEAAVLLPDRDQFLVMPPPPDNNWNPLRQMLRDPYGLPQPLRVRKNDVTAM